MKKTGDTIRDLDGLIWPESKFSWRKASSSHCSEGESGYTLQPLGSAPRTSSIACVMLPFPVPVKSIFTTASIFKT